MNRVSAIHFATGLLARSTWVTLDVPGRRTGRIISFPLVVADYNGERYLVSMLGPDTNWVHNVRAGVQVAPREDAVDVEADAGVRAARELDRVSAGENGIEVDASVDGQLLEERIVVVPRAQLTGHATEPLCEARVE